MIRDLVLKLVLTHTFSVNNRSYGEWDVRGWAGTMEQRELRSLRWLHLNHVILSSQPTEADLNLLEPQHREFRITAKHRG